MRIFVVADDRKLARQLEHVLVVDVMLPGIDGFSIVRKLCEHRVGAPILLLTARDQAEDLAQSCEPVKLGRAAGKSPAEDFGPLFTLLAFKQGGR
jgi:CheY-like chemotaxis protein